MRRIHNDPVGDDLHRLVTAINENCFNTELARIPIYYMAADSGTVCLYDRGDILVDKAYYSVNGISNNLIHGIFHTMVHAYCDQKGIQDTDGDRHLEAFADECDRHGGYCSWNNSQYGYNLTGVKVKKMKRIKKDMEQKGA